MKVEALDDNVTKTSLMRWKELTCKIKQDVLYIFYSYFYFFLLSNFP